MPAEVAEEYSVAKENLRFYVSCMRAEHGNDWNSYGADWKEYDRLKRAVNLIQLPYVESVEPKASAEMLSEAGNRHETRKKNQAKAIANAIEQLNA